MMMNNDTAAIQALLMYHVLNGTYPASAVKATPAFLPTLLNSSMYANVTGGQVVEAVTQGTSVEFYSGLLQNSTVTTANLNFTGGVIHIINKVLTVPENVSTTAEQAGLSALAGALTKANLVEPLDSMMNVTVFAPNNEAFQSIGSATAGLTIQELASILEYHVVNSTVGYSSTLTNGASLTALNGGKLTITIENGNVFVNSAKVITPNVLVSNGVVHVIDNVLNPNMTSATPSPSASGGSPAFSGASSASDIPLTSGIPAPSTTLGLAPSAASATNTGANSSSSKAAAPPMKTTAVGAAALFAAGCLWVNL